MSGLFVGSSPWTDGLGAGPSCKCRARLVHCKLFSECVLWLRMRRCRPPPSRVPTGAGPGSGNVHRWPGAGLWRVIIGPHRFHPSRVHAPLSGCRSIMGDRHRGCRFARPPANFCDPYRGRPVGPHHVVTRRHRGHPDLRVRRIRPLGVHPPQTAPPGRARHPPTTRPEGAEEISRGSSEATTPSHPPPTNRCTPRGVPERGIC